MPQFRYGQYCPLAYALDIVGERWTLLIIRELLHGPRTYKELLQNLPDMGAIKLTHRLGLLERKEIIERRAQEPRSADEPYLLTGRGKKLQGAIQELAAWGLDTLDLPTKYEVYSPLWSLLEFQIRFRADLAQNLNMMFELRIDNETHYVQINHGELKTSAGPAPSPLFVIITDAATFILILRGMLSFRQAVQLKRVDIEGSLAALSKTLDIFGLRAPMLEEKGNQKESDGPKDKAAGFPNIELYSSR